MPYIPEHQSFKNLAGDSVSENTSYEPTPEEKRAIKLVESLFEKSKKHKEKYDEKWLDNYKDFRGKQWKEARPQYRHSEVVNLIFQSIQSSVPIITDARPKFEFIPEEPSDREFAEIMNQISEADWIKYNWQNELVEAVYDAAFYGTGFASMHFDPDMEYGLGAAVMRSEDPFYVFPDPQARDINKESRYFIYAEPLEVPEIRKRYEQGKYVKPDMVDLYKGSKTELDKIKFKSPVDNKTILEGPSTSEIKDDNRSLVKTLYIKDDEIEELEREVQNAKGEIVKEFQQKLKYPKGRKIVVASGVVLEDKEIEYEDGMFPYARLVNYTLPREFFGISDVEQLSGPQKVFNKLLSFSLDVLTLMGNPIWVVDTSSGIDTDNLFNRPGLIVEKQPGSEVRREEGVQLQPFVLQLVDRMKSYFDDVGGQNEVSRGVRPEGITAAEAIKSLQEAAQQRLRLKSRFLDQFLQDLGQMYLSRALQFYSAPRVFRITNNDGSQNYFKLHIETKVDANGEPLLDQKGNPVRSMKLQNFEQLPDGSVGEGPVQERPIKGQLDVRVATGSVLPFAKKEKFAVAQQLFDRGAIDGLELLKAAEYPNAEEIFAKVQERKAAEAAAQMAAGAPPA